MAHAALLRAEALSALARLLPSFSDRGLRTLERAAQDGRLVRGVWSAADAGCPLSCADGVLGMSGARRFFWQAADRNRFVVAWDAGLVQVADVVALVQIEQERRTRVHRPTATLGDGIRRALGRLSALRTRPAV
ncbi:MAG: hypothetical protein KatS3mg060_3706 [Dehalococcoidia bacterium]|nr:MAG: hypothetical protein KatS3mg060_3706 [Dehalococcoidia bacterium]